MGTKYLNILSTRNCLQFVCCFSIRTAFYTGGERSATMSIPEYPTPQNSPVGLVGSFGEGGQFKPHPDWVAARGRTPSPPAEGTERGQRSPTPEWYHDPSGLDHLNPSGIRSGAAYPALQTSNSQSTIARDSVDGNNNNDKPRKRDHLASSVEHVMAIVRRWISPHAGTPLTYACTQSEPALANYTLTLDLEDSSLTEDYWDWESTGFAPSSDGNRASRPRNFSAPPALSNRNSRRVHWWQPLGGHAGSSNENMSTPVSPVTQVPASPRLVGDVMDDELDAQMADLAI